MGRCVLCDFCDETQEHALSLVDEYDRKNWTVKDERTGEYICKRCYDSVSDTLTDYDPLEDENGCVPLPKSWADKYSFSVKRKPEVIKGPRTGTKKDIYPKVPKGTYDTAKGRVVIEQGELVLHGSSRWLELQATEKGATEAGDLLATTLQGTPRKGTPEPTSGLLGPIEEGRYDTDPPSLS